MFYLIAIILILLGIIIYLVLEKKGIKISVVKEWIAKMLYKTKEGIKTFFEIIKQAFIDSLEYFKSWFTKKQPIKETKKVEKHESDRNYMYGNTMNHNNNIRTEYIQIPQKKRGVFFKVVLIIFFIVATGLFIYKNSMLDFDGKYATDRLIYSREHGFCILITYYPRYRKGDSKGFAITHIPFGTLFTEEIQADKNGNDPSDLKEILDMYQLLAIIGDNDLIDSFSNEILDENQSLAFIGNTDLADSLVKSLSTSVMSLRSFDIEKHGKYFVIEAKDVGLKNPFN